jgi:hypothetical protein
VTVGLAGAVPSGIIPTMRPLAEGGAVDRFTTGEVTWRPGP